ncbi:Dabb family protein [Bacillus sp. JCM 19034]|uniref:Dabb family protein n=1 Tax=Bacillus sp. JCM 19034 TaxID=1481928 RepID=UPI000781280F|nr:Dabb family protein [Bacillus sp. JCM 19034]
MIDRTVLLQFSKDTTEEQLEEVIKRFKSLKGNLDGIVDLQAGRNISPRNQEYQVILSVRFKDEAALTAYSENLEHKAVAAYINEVGKLNSIGVDIEVE